MPRCRSSSEVRIPGGGHSELPLKPSIVVVGASGHAKVIIDILEQQDSFKIVGLIDSFKPPKTTLMGYEIIGPEDCLSELLDTKQISGALIAIGHNWIRHNVAGRIRALVPGLPFVNAIHPSAHVGREVALGQGIVLMAGATVNSGTSLGNFCFVNTNASVDHDNTLGEFSCLQPNAATGGNVAIGAFSAVSMGANVIHGVKIGSHTVVGAGSTVLGDVPDSVVAYGTPCRVIRAREPADSYY